MNKVSLGIAGAGAALLFAAAPAVANAVEINCPATQVRREITTPLPGGWWNTPIVNSLTDTAVVNIGGTPALQCRYGPAGSIQRNAPGGMTCTARPGGFSCHPFGPPPPPPTPGTFSTGGISLPQSYLVNFDNGTVGGGGGADLWFHAVDPTHMYLQPRNGAVMAVGDRSNRGWAGCRVAAFSPAPVPLAAVPVGSYVCMKTNAGRISQFRVNGINPGYPKTLQLGYTTWRHP
ncbi:MAG: hypothetical protein Q8L23_04480 [Caulobacter sp.]|nr:hypothetical protein [Caulobacter sp.]